MRLIPLVLCLGLVTALAHAQDGAPSAAPPAAPSVATLSDEERSYFLMTRALERMAHHAASASKEWQALTKAQAALDAAKVAYQARVRREPAFQTYAEQRQRLDTILKTRGQALDWTTGAVRQVATK